MAPESDVTITRDPNEPLADLARRLQGNAAFVLAERAKSNAGATTVTTATMRDAHALASAVVEQADKMAQETVPAPKHNALYAHFKQNILADGDRLRMDASREQRERIRRRIAAQRDVPVEAVNLDTVDPLEWQAWISEDVVLMAARQRIDQVPDVSLYTSPAAYQRAIAGVPPLPGDLSTLPGALYGPDARQDRAGRTRAPQTPDRAGAVVDALQRRSKIQIVGEAIGLIVAFAIIAAVLGACAIAFWLTGTLILKVL